MSQQKTERLYESMMHCVEKHLGTDCSKWEGNPLALTAAEVQMHMNEMTEVYFPAPTTQDLEEGLGAGSLSLVRQDLPPSIWQTKMFLLAKFLNAAAEFVRHLSSDGIPLEEVDNDLPSFQTHVKDYAICFLSLTD